MQRALATAIHARDEALRARLAASFAHTIVADEERLDEALALADLAAAQAVDMTTQVGWRMARARVMVRRERGAQAERLAREGLSIAEQTDSTDLRANALVWAADVRRRAGRPAEAEPFERRAFRLFERAGSTALASILAASLAHTLPGQPTRPQIPDAGTPTQAAEPMHADTPPADEPPPDTPSTSTPVPTPEGSAVGATKLADEMMAMFSASEPPAPEPESEPPAQGPRESEPPASDRNPSEELAGPSERPVAEIDPADELLDDPTRTAHEESHRRWFNR